MMKSDIFEHKEGHRETFEKRLNPENWTMLNIMFVTEYGTFLWWPDVSPITFPLFFFCGEKSFFNISDGEYAKLDDETTP